MYKFLLSSLLFLSFTTQAKVQNLKRIAFGSCNDQNDRQPLWADVIKQKPDLFIWGGDAVYGDWQEEGRTLADAYDSQMRQPQYVKFKEAGIPIIGTWDDHDYAWDNADGRLATKKESQKLFLDFLGESNHSPRRLKEGIYTSYNYWSDGHKVKVILLDNRYFKNLDPKAGMLGEDQWQWFEETLKTSDADLHFIMTGLSIHSPLIRYTEEWGEYPGEFDRLRALMKKYNPKGRVFLTGDKHFSSIFTRWGEIEFMSSGMTHVVDRKVWWYLGRLYTTSWFGLGYGQIDIDWEGDTPLLTMSIRSTDNRDIHLSKMKWQKDHWNWFYKKEIEGFDEREQECCNLLNNKEYPCVPPLSDSCSPQSLPSLVQTWPVNMPPAVLSLVMAPGQQTLK